MKKLLHVGCGQATLKNLPKIFQDGSWQEVRFDIAEEVKPDIIGTLLDMTGVEDCSVDVVYSSHNIEHVFYHEVLQVLAEFKRVLKDDGFAIIACPDLQLICQLALKAGMDAPLYHSANGPITALDIFYGHAESIERGYTYMAHKTGFDLKLMAKRLGEAGFGNFRGKRKQARKELLFVASVAAIPGEEMAKKYAEFTA